VRRREKSCPSFNPKNPVQTIDIYSQVSIPHHKLACQSDSLGTSEQVLIQIASLAQTKTRGVLCVKAIL